MNGNRISVWLLCSTFIIFTAFSSMAYATSSTASYWKDLKRGPYSIGFKTIEQFDYSRTFRPKKDYFGTPLSGERARPIQVCIWYPAKAETGDREMVFGEYSFPYPEDESILNHLNALQNREIIHLHRYFRNNRSRVQNLMNVRMSAIRNAHPDTGAYPMIIYIPYLMGSYSENAVMCEYLASQGFAVASTHPAGMTTYNTELNSADLETQVRDFEFIISVMQNQPYWNKTKLGVIGFNNGCLSSVLFQMRNYDVDAVICLQRSLFDIDDLSLVRSNPYYNIKRMNAPFLQVYQDEERTSNNGLPELLKYSTRYIFKSKKFDTADFSSYSMIAQPIPDSSGTIDNETKTNHDIIYRYISQFFNAYLNNDEQSLNFVKNPQYDREIGQDFLSVDIRQGQDLPPTRSQFMAIIRQNGVGKAVEIFEKFRPKEPDHVFFYEAEFNMLGYQYLQRNNINDAIEIFKMNTEVYPYSANTWDSYGEALLARGDTELGIKCLRKALEVIPADTTSSEQLKNAIRNHIEQVLESLEEE